MGALSERRPAAATVFLALWAARAAGAQAPDPVTAPDPQESACFGDPRLDLALRAAGLGSYAGRVEAELIEQDGSRSLTYRVARSRETGPPRSETFSSPPTACEDLYEIVVQSLSYAPDAPPVPLSWTRRAVSASLSGGLGWRNIAPAGQIALLGAARPSRGRGGTAALELGLTARYTRDTAQAPADGALHMSSLSAPLGLRVAPAGDTGSVSLHLAPGVLLTSIQYDWEQASGPRAAERGIAPCLTLGLTGRVHIAAGLALEASVQTERRPTSLEVSSAGRRIPLVSENYLLLGLSWYRQFVDQSRPLDAYAQ